MMMAVVVMGTPKNLPWENRWMDLPWNMAVDNHPFLDLDSTWHACIYRDMYTYNYINNTT